MTEQRPTGVPPEAAPMLIAYDGSLMP